MADDDEEDDDDDYDYDYYNDDDGQSLFFSQKKLNFWRGKGGKKNRSIKKR